MTWLKEQIGHLFFEWHTTPTYARLDQGIVLAASVVLLGGLFLYGGALERHFRGRAKAAVSELVTPPLATLVAGSRASPEALTAPERTAVEAIFTRRPAFGPANPRSLKADFPLVDGGQVLGMVDLRFSMEDFRHARRLALLRYLGAMMLVSLAFYGVIFVRHLGLSERARMMARHLPRLAAAIAFAAFCWVDCSRFLSR